MKRIKNSPWLLVLCVIAGAFIGGSYVEHIGGNRLNIISSSGSNRINNLLKIIDDQYVDDVDMDSLVEGALPQILSDLDPHSVYISAKDVQKAKDDLKGSFSGVGIEFTIQEDTVRVQNIIKGGPAERAGIIAGDKIVSIDGKPFVGKVVTNEEAMHRLKGPEGTKVEIGVLRYGEKAVKKFIVKRGEIHVSSISAAYMINDSTGFLRAKTFGDTTLGEVNSALAKLSDEGMKHLILDLRDNSGGYLHVAVALVDEFLPAGRLIVYTEGRKAPREDYRSSGSGRYQDLPLVVLINESSASAAEIVAGALQDNDRATIIGRRSFGKGLVQQQISFTDGSMIRLTVARYYTPSGRCIQKPYTVDGKGYEYDLISRYQNGELFNQDSIKHEGPAYHTTIGREVYGGGGITPDIFVPEDTTQSTTYYVDAARNGLILQYAFKYTDQNRPRLKAFTTMPAMERYLKSQGLVERFADYGESHGLKRRNLLIEKSYRLLERYIHSRIIYNMLDEEAWMEYLNRDDNDVKEALKVVTSKDWKPKKGA